MRAALLTLLPWEMLSLSHAGVWQYCQLEGTQKTWHPTSTGSANLSLMRNTLLVCCAGARDTRQRCGGRLEQQCALRQGPLGAAERRRPCARRRSLRRRRGPAWARGWHCRYRCLPESEGCMQSLRCRAASTAWSRSCRRPARCGALGAGLLNFHSHGELTSRHDCTLYLTSRCASPCVLAGRMWDTSARGAQHAADRSSGYYCACLLCDCCTLPDLAQVREAKVRRAGIGGRARLAGELRDMDDEVRPCWD